MSQDVDPPRYVLKFFNPQTRRYEVAVQPAFGGKSCQHPLEDSGSGLGRDKSGYFFGWVGWHVCELKCWSNIVMEDDMLVFIDVIIYMLHVLCICICMYEPFLKFELVHGYLPKQSMDEMRMK